MIHAPKPIAPMNPEGLEDIARQLLNETPEIIPTSRSVIPSTVNGADYIKIPNTSVLISKEEIHKGKKWKDAHYALADSGLFMPSPALFLPYFLNVRDAAQGTIMLCDGNNKSIHRTEVQDLWSYLSSGHRGGCWTWLDAMFKETNGAWTIETNHRVIAKNGKKELQGTSSPLERCIREDSYIDLSFNKQGLPASKSSIQNYQQGQNIQYYHPRNNAVSRFRADSGWVDLGCYEDPRGSGAGLGVFACAAGTPKT